MIKVAIAYTSVSTALNQNESVNVKAKLPTKALPKIATAVSCSIASSFTLTSLRNNIVIVQNIKSIVKALDTALIIFNIIPICAGSNANSEKNAPNI